MPRRGTTRSVGPFIQDIGVGAEVWIAKVQNGEAYRKVQFRPRILRKVAEADASTTIMGKKSSIPVFISPA